MLEYIRGFGAEDAASLIRHAMTALGPLLAAHGIADAATLETVGGALIAMIGLIWGQASPQKRAERARRAAERAGRTVLDRLR